MKFLDRLVPERAPATRYSLEDLAHDMGFSFGGSFYPTGVQTSWGSNQAEPIGNDFTGYAQGALKSNGIISAIELLRVSVFSEARFQFQEMRNGRPGDLFGTPALGLLERPFVGGVTGDLLSRMLLDADLAGNAFVTNIDGELVRLRPDWVEIVYGYRSDVQGYAVGKRKVGYLYYENGRQSGNEAAAFLPHEVAHFAPFPDPECSFRGMSWMTPVIREIKADKQATSHKLMFFENAATPNLAVSLKEVTPEQFEEFVELMDKEHKGAHNAYKTLYTAGGADVSVIGANMQQLDFKATQGAGETRIAAASGVHPVLLGLSEGLAGSSLNAGNYAQARRRFIDGTMSPLWRNAAGSLETLIKPPAGSRLWYDTRDVRFLREDEKDIATIQQIQATALRSAVDAGYNPDAIVKFLVDNDLSRLLGEHSGLFSIQLQEPGSGADAGDVTP